MILFCTFSRLSSACFLAFVMVISGCGGDSGSEDNIVGPGGNGGEIPSGTISYSQHIAPIFQASCGGSGCHINNSKNGVNLTSYAQVLGSVGDQYGTAIVVAGNAESSPLVDKLGSNPLFGDRMPDGKSALSSNQITTIRMWINDGALNN